MKKYVFISIALFSMLFMGANGCENSVDRKQSEKQAQILEEQNRQLGLPNISNFTQKRTLKDIQEQCDRVDNILYCYTYSEYTGKLIYFGRCIGYPIPFSTQYTNPERAIYSSTVISQADPNGLFMPSSSEATWIMLVNPKTNKPSPVYVEPKLIVSPFPLTN